MADEITLEVYLQIWKQACNYNKDRGVPLVWLVTITRSRAIDQLRQNKRLRSKFAPIDDTFVFIAKNRSPETATLFSERRQQVQLALSQISTAQREALMLDNLGFRSAQSKPESVMA